MMKKWSAASPASVPASIRSSAVRSDLLNPRRAHRYAATVKDRAVPSGHAAPDQETSRVPTTKVPERSGVAAVMHPMFRNVSMVQTQAIPSSSHRRPPVISFSSAFPPITSLIRNRWKPCPACRA